MSIEAHGPAREPLPIYLRLAAVQSGYLAPDNT